MREAGGRTRRTVRRILFVTPRLSEVVGGSETHLRAIASRLAALGGFHVEMATTCATSDATWENVLPAGRSVVGGLAVHRFPAETPGARAAAFHRWILSRGGPAIALDRLGWRPPTVASPGLSAFLRESRDDWDAVVAAPCVYGTTAAVVAEVPGRSVLVPCVHDEPAARLPSTGRMLRAASRRYFNTEYERDLVRRLHGDAAAAGPIVGLGVESPADVAPVDEVRARFGLEGDYLVHAGRWAPGKGIEELVGMVRAHAVAFPAEAIALVLAGPGRRASTIAPTVRHLGWLDPRSLAGLVAAATAHASFSRMESLSIALLEAWALGTPALVHADSGLLDWQVRRSGGGVSVRSLEEFAEAIRRLRRPETRAGLAAAGARLLREESSWDRVLEAFVDGLPDPA